MYKTGYYIIYKSIIIYNNTLLVWKSLYRVYEIDNRYTQEKFRNILIVYSTFHLSLERMSIISGYL